MFDLIIRNAYLVDGTGAEPYTADIAILNGVVAEIGSIEKKAKREIDAQGHLVSPGWVDIHTHYDGQVTWDPYLSPSGWNGVTTAVIGNCGVGFAPAKPDRHDWLIGLMEGVEDIPGAALAEGITWEWESFPEYLDALEKMPRALDVATQVPHGSVRAYVMGERGARNEAATPEDIAAMAEIVEEGLRAGALGFSTSRTILHLSIDGEPVPGTFANRDELLGIAGAMAKVGHGVFEMASDMTPAEDEFRWMAEASKDTGIPVTYALLQNPVEPQNWKKLLTMTDEAVAEGAQIKAQIAMRPTGLIMGWQSTVHPFSFYDAYAEIADRPFAERLEILRTPEMKQKLVEGVPRFEQVVDVEDGSMGSASGLSRIVARGYHTMFALMKEGVAEYEPAPEDSIAARAEALKVSPAELVYDMMMENDGTGYVYLPLLNYADFNFDHIAEMFHNPNTVVSLSDGGAHCGVITDASMPTYLLTHWVRSRTRGDRIALAAAVKAQTHDTARLYGLDDRGTITVGQKADLNIIDLQKLNLGAPEMVFDLPAGGRRLIQKVDGYLYTIVNGVVTYENGTPTGQMPGRLIRGRQSAAVMDMAAE